MKTRTIKFLEDEFDLSQDEAIELASLLDMDEFDNLLIEGLKGMDPDDIEYSDCMVSMFLLHIHPEKMKDLHEHIISDIDGIIFDPSREDARACLADGVLREISEKMYDSLPSSRVSSREEYSTAKTVFKSCGKDVALLTDKGRILLQSCIASRVYKNVTSDMHYELSTLMENIDRSLYPLIVIDRKRTRMSGAEFGEIDWKEFEHKTRYYSIDYYDCANLDLSFLDRCFHLVSANIMKFGIVQYGYSFDAKRYRESEIPYDDPLDYIPVLLMPPEDSDEPYNTPTIRIFSSMHEFLSLVRIADGDVLYVHTLKSDS